MLKIAQKECEELYPQIRDALIELRNNKDDAQVNRDV